MSVLDSFPNWKLILATLGLDTGPLVGLFFRDVESIMSTKFDFLPKDEGLHDLLNTLGEWVVGDATDGIRLIGSGLYLCRDGAYTPIGTTISALISSQRLNVARSYYPVESREKQWQVASAINAVMTLIGPCWAWKAGPDQAYFDLRGAGDTGGGMEIPFDSLTKYVRELLSRGDIDELTSPSRITDGLRAIAVNVN